MTKYHIFYSSDVGNEHYIAKNTKELKAYLEQVDECDIVGVVKGGVNIETSKFNYKKEDEK